MTSAMICPKCRGEMTSYERNGITIDQCTECRGIFLDRGELERLIDAEAAFATRAPVQPQAQSYQQPQDQYRQQGYHDQRDSDYYKRRDKQHRRHGGFLSELFD